MSLMNFIYATITAIVLFSLAVLYLVIRRRLAEQKVKVAEQTAKRILEDAKKEAETKRREAILEAKDHALKQRSEFEKETKERKGELLSLEKRLMQREEKIDSKEKDLGEEVKKLKSKEAEIVKVRENLETIRQQHVKELERISGISKDEAKTMLLKNLERDVERDAAQIIKKKEEEIRKEAEKRAREILTTTIQRCAVDHVVETTTSLVELPSDDMKGRIIGREGRNIRAFETLTGVDLIVDDTPEAVILSSFDPFRRETARLTLQKLIQDGRIHPARVEEMYDKAQKEIKDAMWKYGEQAALETDIHGLPPVIIQLLGRLRYRTSYGQNALQHTIEVAHLAGMLASELGVNVKLAKRGGLLHDIGKAVDLETEGTHVQLGAKLAEKAGESKEVIHAIMSHHGDEEAHSVEAILVGIADAISASRPGARRDTLEAYIKRLERLESVAKEFEGVEKVYAIQAGREVRVIVEPKKIDDVMAAKLAHDIAKKIESELEYPGEVKVTVIRETRSSGVAK